jgi:hypothetical protein
MDLLESFEFEKEGVQSTKVFKRAGIDIQNRGERKTEQEVVDCSTAKLPLVEIRQPGDISCREMECIEPIDATFLTVGGSVNFKEPLLEEYRIH